MHPLRPRRALRRVVLLCSSLLTACAAERLEARATDGPGAAGPPTPSPRPTELSQNERLLAPPPDAGAPAKKPTSYVCPMHPAERSHEPGRCKLCGMNLVPEDKP